MDGGVGLDSDDAMTPRRHKFEKRKAAAQGAHRRATARPRLTVDIEPSLKRRIKVAAAAQDLPVSAYIAKVLERGVPHAEMITKLSDGIITSEMVRRAERLRAEQKESFPEDSADLIREMRAQRYREL
ncbi:MAG: hypothetical protein ACREQI_09620 [Candidatus Binataceae bacterium]